VGAHQQRILHTRVSVPSAVPIKRELSSARARSWIVTYHGNSIQCLGSLCTNQVPIRSYLGQAAVPPSSDHAHQASSAGQWFHATFRFLSFATMEVQSTVWPVLLPTKYRFDHTPVRAAAASSSELFCRVAIVCHLASVHQWFDAAVWAWRRISASWSKRYSSTYWNPKASRSDQRSTPEPCGQGREP
jgi:hypothetical protein